MRSLACNENYSLAKGLVYRKDGGILSIYYIEVNAY